jgi:hypothetical protein
MRYACRPTRRLFLLVLLTASVINGQTPPLTTISEGLFKDSSSADKQNAAMSFLQAALSMAESVSSKQIADEAGFKAGLEQIIGGTVACLNASVWAKAQTR